jgi:serine protease Do
MFLTTPARALATTFGLVLLASACGTDVARPATTAEHVDHEQVGGPSTLPAQPSTTVGEPADPRPSDTPTTPAAPAPDDEPDDGPDGLERVAASTVQIFAQGSFVDPEFGAYEGAGSGTGFVIDEGGIAVTNNHVVTGAGMLQVVVPGDDEPRNAKVVAVSECSDLAVIDIAGDDIPALDWYEGDVTPGLDVYAAGYPLSDPEYTLTRGIVAKADAIGDTGWASIDHTLEHDASTQPGNSGGPLVTAGGKVVGVNFATWGRTNTDQFFAIDAQDAQAVIAQLMTGVDVDSLGINGQAVVSDDGTLAGVWVSGVASGSPADLAGLAPGDIVTRIEGVSIGTDGTMRDYCDVLRSHDASDTLSLEVLRFATSEVLTGQINGAPLTTAFSFADELDDQAADGAAYTEYTMVTDDTGTLSVSVPVEWFDLDGAPVDIDGVSSPSIVAAPNVSDFLGTWNAPGVQFVASEALAGYTADELLDLAALPDCVSDGREDYDDGAFAGRYEMFSSCGGTATSAIVVAAFPPDSSYGVLVVVQVVSDADLAALDQVLRSFDVLA